MKLLAIVVLLILKINLVAQSVVPQQVRATNFIDGVASGIRTGEMNFGIPLPPTPRIGHYYLTEHWNNAAILLYQDQKMITGYSIRYNLQDQIVEVKMKGNVTGISVEKIKSLSWIDSATSSKKIFINCHEYNINGTPCAGLVEVLVDGRWALLKKTSVYIKRSNYVPALDIGKNVDEIQKKDNYFFSEGNQLFAIKKKTVFLNDFKNRGISLESFIKANNLNLRKENDLIAVFEQLNKSN